MYPDSNVLKKVGTHRITAVSRQTIADSYFTSDIEIRMHSGESVIFCNFQMSVSFGIVSCDRLYIEDPKVSGIS